MTAPAESTARTPGSDAGRAELLSRRLAGRRSAGRRGLPAAAREEPPPLSAGQRQLWFLQQLDPGATAYLLPMAYRLRGPLDVPALRASFEDLTARHEILRTRYAVVGDGPRQLIDPPGPVDWRLEDRPDAPGGAAGRDAAAVAFAESCAARPMDLATEPPLRVSLLRLAEDDHVLVVVAHHIACDAPTRPLLLAQLAEAYRDRIRGRAPQPGSPPTQYADYAAWLNERQDRPEARRDLEWWRARLDGVTPLELPADRPRPATRSWDGATTALTVPADTAARLREVAADTGSSLYIVLLTAFQVLLGRYAGRRDVTVGTAVSTRTRPELDSMAGYAFTSLALRARWSGDPAFTSLVAANRGRVLDAFDRRDTPFDRIADAVDPERDPSVTPVFQVMFDLVEGAGQDRAPELEGLRAEPVPAAGRVARFDLTLHLTARSDGSLEGSLEYATALFDSETARRVAGHYARLLHSVAKDPASPLSGLEILGAQERALLMDGPAQPVGTRTPLDASALEPVHLVIARQAASTPHAPAVRFTGGSLTYAQLLDSAHRFAAALRRRGTGPEDVVGVLLDRGPELVPALLGCWLAGAAYLPVDPGYPDDRVAYLLGDTGSRLVITERRHAARLADTGSALLVVDDPGAAAELNDPRPDLSPGPPVRHDLDALAYVIYTSGSTGRPKGVMVSHRGLANYLGWTAQAYATAGDGGAPLFSSIAFDLGVPNLYTPLLTGQAVHLLPQELDTDGLGRALVDGGPYAFVKLTPGHLDLLRRQLTDEEAGALAGLVIAAGDSFTARLAGRWTAASGPAGARLAAEYGPTEITVGNSAHFVEGPVGGELVPIGRAIPHTTMYVLDEELRPLPVGVAGEVWIGGIGLARGYAGRPALTAERFVPDPHGPPGARLYRTGDVARVLPDGELDFLSRTDHQVKLRGYRVEPGEIEAALTDRAEVAEAVVLVREDSPGDRRLVAYVVPAPGRARPTPAALREGLAGRLPAYLLPAAYLLLDELPLTPNGKLDRRALPAPGRAATAVGEHTAARNATERAVAEVWRTVLGLDDVGVHDNFFDLGGDSIRAVTLVGALRDAGWDTSVRDLFEHRTVARLSAGLTAADPGADGGHVPVEPFGLLDEEERAALPEGVVDAYPVSRTQAGMLVEMYGGDENRYHNVTSFRVRDEEPFDGAAFRQAADLIVGRHEVMRTSFALTGHRRPLQLVHATARMEVTLQDLRTLPPADRDPALRAFALADRQRLFDPVSPPLMRMAVHLTDDTGWWLSITESHPVIEGWSYHSQLMELLRAYRRLRAGLPPDPAPPAPAVRYADFVAAELRSLDDPADRAYWAGIVDGYEKATVPAGWAGPGSPDGLPERYRVDIPLTGYEPGLRALATSVQVPYKSVLHAAHSKVLALLTRSPAFRGGMVADARPEVSGAERVSGMYLNSVPFPYRAGARTWGELAREVFSREVELWPHRRFPMPAMRRRGGERHLVDVLFHYLDFHQVDTGLVDIMASRDDSPNEFPLVVGTPVRGRLSIASDTRTLDRRAADRLAALYREVLAAMAAGGPDGDATGTFPLPGDLGGLRTVSPAVAEPVAPLTAFEQQAARTPQAVAVTGPGRGPGSEVTYAALDARAGRTARRLRDLGAGPGTRVAVVLDRGPALVAALLAVWKAGAVQVPVDPCTPGERIDAMLSGAGCTHLITEARHAGRAAGAAAGGVLVVGEGPDAGPVLPPGQAYGEHGHPAYVLHTSGSTGTPKGVEVGHRALAERLDHAVRQYAAAGSGGAPCFTSVGFDLGLPALWAPLMTGQRVHLLPQDTAAHELGERLAAGAPYSFVGLTPGHLTLLEEQLPGAGPGSLAPLLVTAGEALPAGQAARVLRRAREAGTPLRLAAEYGPTEATVAATVHPVTGEEQRPLVPLGRPLPGTTVRLLDERLDPVPQGVTGELFLGGSGLAEGYAGRPDLTAASFVPDPYGPPGSRLYRTGDLARVLPDGTAEFTGRTDDQVKIRGHRVEPGEAEAVLRAAPGVRDALVAAVPAADGGVRLAAWVIPADAGRPPSAGRLRDRLRAALPAVAVPGTVGVTDELPLTDRGKRDRRRLPDRVRESTGTGSVPVAPRNPTEELLAAAWAEVLGLDRVGVHDDFREVGGDSLLVPPLLVAAHRAGVRLEFGQALRHRTIAAQAAAVDGSPSGTPRKDSPDDL